MKPRSFTVEKISPRAGLELSGPLDQQTSAKHTELPGLLLVWVIVGQEPTVLAVGAGEELLFGYFFLSPPYRYSFSLSLGVGLI